MKLICAMVYRGVESSFHFSPQIKVEIATVVDDVERIIQVLTQATNMKKIKEEKIFVYDLEYVECIRTGEINTAALYLRG